MNPQRRFMEFAKWWTRNWTDRDKDHLTDIVHPKFIRDYGARVIEKHDLIVGIMIALSNDYKRTVQYPFPADTGPTHCGHGVSLKDDCVECLKQHLEEVIR